MDQIEEIRAKIDLVAFIGELVPLKKAGRNFKGLCPFHTEKTPSFMVSPERQIWKCFGCQRGGDVYRFLMETERLEFGEALRLLAKKVGITLHSYRPTQGEAEKERLFALNHLASEFYHYLLLKHRVGEKALAYIRQRGVSQESLATFKIGYAPALWDGLQRYLVARKGYSPGELEKAGLIIASQPATAGHQSRYYDRFRDRLVFPLADHRGNVVGFAGRLLDPNAKEAKYVNTPETVLYHKGELLYPLSVTKEAIKKANSAVVVEGELDAISCFQVGVENVVAIKGSALTEMQARLLKRFAESLVMALDTDSAGVEATKRGVAVAEMVGLNLGVTVLSKYKDPDEAAQKEPAYLKQQLEQRQNVYDYLVSAAFDRWRGQTAEEKRKIGQELLPVLNKIEDEIVKNLFVKKLADRLEVGEESVALQMEKLRLKLPLPAVPAANEQRQNRREVLEQYLLALLFQGKKVEELLNVKLTALFQTPGNLKLIRSLPACLKQRKRFSSRFFYSQLPAELREIFDRLYLVDLGERVDDIAWLGKEVARAAKQLRVWGLKEELRESTRQLAVEKIRRLTQQLTEEEKN